MHPYSWEMQPGVLGIEHGNISGTLWRRYGEDYFWKYDMVGRCKLTTSV